MSEPDLAPACCADAKQGNQHQCQHGWLGYAGRGEPEIPDELMRLCGWMHTVPKQVLGRVGADHETAKSGLRDVGKSVSGRVVDDAVEHGKRVEFNHVEFRLRRGQCGDHSVKVGIEKNGDRAELRCKP